jgi:hypothetical protein
VCLRRPAVTGLTIADPAFLAASSAGFSPLSLSPALWLDASDASTITASSGFVSQWNDKSGNGRNFTQALLGNQPITGTDTQNALNTLRFNDNHFMSAGDVLDLGTSSISVFMVARRNTGINSTIIGKYKVTPATGSWLMLWETAGVLKLQSLYVPTGGTVSAITAGTWTSTAFNTIGHVTDRVAGTITQRVNKATNGTITFTPDSTSNRNIATSLYLGGLRNAADSGMLAGYFLKGNIAELVICLAALSTSERDALETYLSAKWGI